MAGGLETLQSKEQGDKASSTASCWPPQGPQPQRNLESQLRPLISLLNARWVGLLHHSHQHTHNKPSRILQIHIPFFWFFQFDLRNLPRKEDGIEGLIKTHGSHGLR